MHLRTVHRNARGEGLEYDRARPEAPSDRGNYRERERSDYECVVPRRLHKTHSWGSVAPGRLASASSE